MADLPKENQANKNKPISVSVLALPPLSAALPKLPPPPPPPPPQDPAVQDLTQEDSNEVEIISVSPKRKRCDSVQSPPKRAKVQYDYKCRHCQQILRDAASLRQHSEKVHNLFDPKRLNETCSFCGKGYHSIDDYNAHIGRQNICGDDRSSERWVNQQPQTKADRAATWAFCTDGQVPNDVKIRRGSHENPIELD